MDHGEGTPIPQKDLGIAATPERPHGLEAGRMAKYKPAFEHLIPQVEAKIDDPERYSSDYALMKRVAKTNDDSLAETYEGEIKKTAYQKKEFGGNYQYQLLH